jgi:hypothetical protein
MQPAIIIDHDKVEIEGVTIKRPCHISPSQWLEFWKRAIDKCDSEDD